MKKIVVATDGSADADRAVDRALEISKKENAEVIVVNVAEEYCPAGLVELDCDIIRDLVMKESKGIMAAALEKLRAGGVQAKGVIEVGNPADVIVEIAKKEKADEIITASHGRHGVKKFAMGSVALRVVEWAPCSVLVVK